MTKPKLNPLKPWATVDPIDRLFRRIAYDHGCWVWTGTKDRRGYGKMFGPDGKSHQRVHRVAYELLVGPIPEGFHLDHLCRNTSCCNPLHVEPVTCRENVIRGASYRGDEERCVNGHAFDEANTYWRMSGTRQYRVCRACRSAQQHAARAEGRWKRKPWRERPEAARSRAETVRKRELQAA
jgi:hypothetical protein